MYLVHLLHSLLFYVGSFCVPHILSVKMSSTCPTCKEYDPNSEHEHEEESEVECSDDDTDDESEREEEWHGDSVPEEDTASASEVKDENRKENDKDEDSEDIEFSRCLTKAEPAMATTGPNHGYGGGGHRNHGHHGHGKPRKRRLERTRVYMPSGKHAYITKPEITNWQCGTNSKTKLITLNPQGRLGRREYELVASELKDTMMTIPGCAARGGCYTSYKIVKLQKIVNGCLWRKYRDAQRDIKREAGFVNERMLFHGSGKTSLIVKSGFDERYANQNGVFGAGLYFAHNSSASNEYTFGILGGNGCPLHMNKSCTVCERTMLLCRVTLGKTQKHDEGGHHYPHPPPGFNSVKGKNGANSYMEYVIYRGEQAYPEYLITYTIVP